MCNQIVRSEILGNNFTRVSLAFDQTQVKLFPNFTSIPLDYLLISWVTNYVSNLGFLTCLSRIVSIKNPGGDTPIHYLYGYVPPNGVVILKLLIQNGVSISEAFSRTGYNISNAWKLQFCKQPFEIIQGQFAFKNTVQCVNKQTVVIFAPKNGV